MNDILFEGRSNRVSDLDELQKFNYFGYFWLEAIYPFIISECAAENKHFNFSLLYISSILFLD